MKLISVGIIVNTNYVGTILNGLIQEVKLKGINLFSFSFFYVNKGDRTSHWVGYLDLKEIDTNDFFKRKHIIEDMESELTEA